MDDFTSLAVAKLGPTIVGFVFGPLLTMIAKKITSLAGRPLESPIIKLGISTVGGGLSALVVGDINGLADALKTLLEGVIAGFGGAKVRDAGKGKVEVVTKDEKKIIDATFGNG